MNKYVIITPARDEEEHIEKTIQSVVAQTLRPVQWIIVNDGSRDRTGAIIDSYAARYEWITAHHRPNRGFREAGGGVMDTFHDGYKLIKVPHWDFIVKLDADLIFEVDYFKRCFAEFEKDHHLGVGGGGIYHESDGQLKLEGSPKFHVRGATKIYRRECWEGIGGLQRVAGWDTIDEVKANMLGWTTRTFFDLKVSHQRYTGSADGVWKDCVKNGRANYITGYHPLFMLAKCARRIGTKPYVKAAVGLWWGYMSSYWKRTPRVQDHSLIKYTRDQQLRRLLLQESIWK
jgi:glycosyltransferase involved in cell wall biosynthesis